MDGQSFDSTALRSERTETRVPEPVLGLRHPFVLSGVAWRARVARHATESKGRAIGRAESRLGGVTRPSTPLRCAQDEREWVGLRTTEEQRQRPQLAKIRPQPLSSTCWPYLFGRPASHLCRKVEMPCVESAGYCIRVGRGLVLRPSATTWSRCWVPCRIGARTPLV